jgi:hypothetical protein
VKDLRVSRLRAALERLARPDFTYCGRCKRPWKEGTIGVPEHVTWYSESSGVFALCESCWEQLGSPEARMPFYEENRHQWSDWDLIAEAVGAGG